MSYLSIGILAVRQDDRDAGHGLAHREVRPLSQEEEWAMSSEQDVSDQPDSEER